jgi:hypothetical protein
MYPVWWDTDLTIYNRYEDPETNVVKWYRYSVSGAFYKHVKQKVVIGSETLEIDRVMCRMREHPAYLDKHIWVQLDDKDKASHFTVGRGDIIVKGIVEDEIDEYTKGKRSSDINAKYKELQGCFVVDLTANNTGPGRCEPHYRAEGI